MCGLVGYIGKSMCRESILKGLSRIEYRGYDSAGFACIHPQTNEISYQKVTGQLQNLVAALKQTPIDGHVGIGHTRWSTHGATTCENAHPQFDCNKQLSLAHNGIIENHRSIKQGLVARGHRFVSQTDTETIAHLFEELIESCQALVPALVATATQLDGAYALICISHQFPDTLIAVRKGSPLVIGVGRDEVCVASDQLAFVDVTDQCIFVPDKSFAIVKADSIKLYDFRGNSLPTIVQKIDTSFVDATKEGFEHFMLKEIYEQKRAVQQSIYYAQQPVFLNQLGLTIDQLRDLKSIDLIGCGTSWHAARIAQFFFESVVSIPCGVKLASEFRYMPFFAKEDNCTVIVSQSGETADALEALRLVSAHGMPTIGLTNVPSSTIVREADGFMLTHAGQEVAVASTKAFATQMALLYWFAHFIALHKGLIGHDVMNKAEHDLLLAAEVLENTMENYKLRISNSIAPSYAQFKKFIFLGRHISYPFAMEAALKLKEISYIFTQCYPAGELKHGPLALVDQETPVWIFSHLDSLIYQKLLSNAQEVRAREGHILVFAFEGQDELIELADTAIILPAVNPLLAPLAMTGVMQLLVYHIAKILDCPIDRPRNLAKSVTVE